MNKPLESFGFTENEVRVYEGFFRNPDISGAALARRLKMDKSSTYRAIESLKERGFLIASHGRSTIVYKASNPALLSELSSERKLKLEDDSNRLSNYITELISESKTERSPYIIIEEGLEALQRRMTESLQSKDKEIRERFRYHPFFKNKDHVQFVKDYAHQRTDKKIMIKQLDSDIPKLNKVFRDMFGPDENQYKEIRILPEEITDNNSLRIWDNTVNIVSFEDQDKFIILTIKDPFLAGMMKNMYDYIWERSEKVGANYEQIKNK